MVDRLEAELAVQRLLADYGHIMDDSDWDALGRIFTEDAVCDWTDFGLRVTTGLADLQEYFATSVRHPNAHHVTNVVVHFDADEAVVRSKLLVVLDDGTVATGEYLDRMRRTGDGWRIYHRVATPRRRPSTADRRS